MSSDTLDLSPGEYASLLTKLARDDTDGTDSYGSGGVVDALEARMAETLGKPAAVIMPTGTMSNLLAIQALAGKARKVIVQTESHLYNDCGDCAQSLGGMNLVPLGKDATFGIDAIQRVIERIDDGKVAAPIGVISIESPVRRLDGEMFDFDEMQAVCSFARERNIRLHLDGARGQSRRQGCRQDQKQGDGEGSLLHVGTPGWVMSIVIQTLRAAAIRSRSGCPGIPHARRHRPAGQ